jgi:hypothetical protein
MKLFNVIYKEKGYPIMTHDTAAAWSKADIIAYLKAEYPGVSRITIESTDEKVTVMSR